MFGMSVRFSFATGRAMVEWVAAAARLIAIALAVSLIGAVLVVATVALFFLLAPLALVLAFFLSVAYRARPTAPYVSDIIIEPDYTVVDEDYRRAR
jgi:hypothetical protein